MTLFSFVHIITAVSFSFALWKASTYPVDVYSTRHRPLEDWVTTCQCIPLVIDAIEPGFDVVVVVVVAVPTLRFDITDSLPTSDTLPLAFALFIIPYNSTLFDDIL